MIAPAGPRIERLLAPTGGDLDDLARLLVDAVEGGAAASFLAPLPLDTARHWWRGVFDRTPGPLVLVARDERGIVGTVQMQPAWAPNQPHRGDIAKLLVDRGARRGGLGTRLMEAIERVSAEQGITLLTLDTRRGDTAERLYRRRAWTEAGCIPGFALDNDGTPHDAVIFYKRLS